MAKKNLVLFIIYYSISSEFITRAANKISSSEQLLCKFSQKASKTFLKRFVI